MVDIKSAISIEELSVIEQLAFEIWNEHYTPIIGKAQVDYMLDKFQSSTAMQLQIKEGYKYYSINLQTKPVGYLSYLINEDDLFLSKIYILKTERGKKIGKQAINFTVNQAQLHNCKTITLTVNKNNLDSIKAYEKLGFNKDSKIVLDIGNGFVMDDYKMVKQL